MRFASMTPTSWQRRQYDRHCPSAVYYLCVLIWHWNIRARRMWVHDMIHKRPQYSEYCCLSQEKQRRDITSTFLKSWKIFQFEVLRKMMPDAATFLWVANCCCRCLLLIGINWRKKKSTGICMYHYDLENTKLAGWKTVANGAAHELSITLLYLFSSMQMFHLSPKKLLQF